MTCGEVAAGVVVAGMGMLAALMTTALAEIFGADAIEALVAGGTVSVAVFRAGAGLVRTVREYTA